LEKLVFEFLRWLRIDYRQKNVKSFLCLLPYYISSKVGGKKIPEKLRNGFEQLLHLKQKKFELKHLKRQ